MKGRTSIPIAVDGARLDRILVLDDDIIAKQGSHAGLAKRPGRNLSASPFRAAFFPRQAPGSRVAPPPSAAEAMIMIDRARQPLLDGIAKQQLRNCKLYPVASRDGIAGTATRATPCG
ncbi:hypothetical protein ACVWZK_008604 [Bradyrhizobium sp. GM0.4]